MTGDGPIVRPEIIVVGASAGGLRAFEQLFGGLPADFPVPIVAVQHRARDSRDAYADLLTKWTRLPVREVEDNDILRAPGVYLAPPDYHLLIERGRLVLSVDEPVSHSRPSIDVLFETAADVYGARVVGVLLTGANADGSSGLLRIKQAGGFAIVQDPHTAESSTMPAAAIARAPVDRVLPLAEIAAELVRVVA